MYRFQGLDSLMTSKGITDSKTFDAYLKEVLSKRESQGANLTGFTFDTPQLDFDYEVLQAEAKVDVMASYVDLNSPAVPSGHKVELTSIKGYVDGIRDGIADTPEKHEHYLRTIYLKAEAIEQMAENLSIYSKLELGRVQYSRERLDIIKHLSNIAYEFSLDLQTADIDLTVNLPDTAVYVMADAEKLRRVFANIITNAIKYKRPGKGSLDISAEVTENGLLITFSDSGIGISEKELPHIFDGFYRGDPSRNSKIEGNGLGLSISCRIISDHGGKIWARSTENIGTDMMIILPMIK